MTRLLPLLTLAFLPALVAAPVPRDTRPTFGANGLLSRAELDRVEFASREMKLDDRAIQRADAVEDNGDREDVRKRADDAPENPWPENRFDVAVHMPWKVFREGDPIPAYLVLRNNRPSTLGLRSSIDLSGTFPEFHGGAASFDVRDRATGKSMLKGLAAATNCGGGSLIDVPADGYFVTRGDLGRFAEKGYLPAGDYEVYWEYIPFRSAPVRFSVVKADGLKLAAAKRPLVHFLHVSEGGERAERLQAVGEPFVWRECRLESLYTDSMAAALAVGQNGVYVPDLYTIPAADQFVEACVEWKHYREGDRVSVTLRAKPPYREVWFDELPQLYFQIESPRDASDRDWSRNACGLEKAMDRARDSWVTPLTIEARLPQDWREQVGVKDSAQVAVLVTSKRLEMPTRGERIKRLMREKRLERVGDDERPPIWSGTVRTEFVELQFPPRPPRAAR
jgi:hypothetical protein